MAITTNWATKTFSVPQADLTLASGTLYDMDTEVDFRQKINAIMASEEGIVFEDPIDHNTEYTVAGVTYARKIEVINGYSLTFTPDSQWTVRLGGSNNNLFDVENGILNQNQVQVIAQNSAGLIRDPTADPDAIWTRVLESGYTIEEALRIILSSAAGKLSGAAGTSVKIRDVNDTKDRIDATVDEDGNRTAVTLDGS